MKVLHVQLLPMMSGVQRVSLNEVEKLRHKIDYALLCSCSGPLTEELEKLGVKSEIVGSLRRNISPLNDLKSLFAMRQFIKKNRFNVVHTHSSKTGVLGRVASKMAGVKKVVHTVHGFAFPLAKSRVEYFFYYFLELISKYFTDVLIVLNEQDYDFAVNKLGYSEKAVHLIENGVDVDQFYPIVNRNNDRITVTMVGRLWEQKDPMTFVRAAHQLSNFDNVRFIIAGGGDLFDQVSEFILNNDLSDKIELMDWCSSIPSLLRESDIFVLPSKWEGMPLAILEAMSSGLPCVVSNISGNNSLVENGVNGYLFPVQDFERLSSILKELILDPEKRASLGAAARNKVLHQYSLDKRNDRVMGIYLND